MLFEDKKIDKIDNVADLKDNYYKYEKKVDNLSKREFIINEKKSRVFLTIGKNAAESLEKLENKDLFIKIGCFYSIILFISFFFIGFFFGLRYLYFNQKIRIEGIGGFNKKASNEGEISDKRGEVKSNKSSNTIPYDNFEDIYLNKTFQSIENSDKGSNDSEIILYAQKEFRVSQNSLIQSRNKKRIMNDKRDADVMSEIKHGIHRLKMITNDNSPIFNQSLISNYITREDSKKYRKSDCKKKYKYTLLNLCEIDMNQAKNTPDITLKQNQNVDFLNIAKFSITIPMVTFNSALEANKTIKNVRKILFDNKSDSISKSLQLLLILGIGASYNFLDNPNYFISIFNDFIESIVDSGIVFHLLKYVNINIQKMFIDMIITYVWSHWVFKHQKNFFIYDKFKKWKLYEPTVQNHETLFRLICNMELGIFSVKNMDKKLKLQSEIKINCLMRECILNSYCNEYISFIPMLLQAIRFVKFYSIKSFFYEFLFIIIQCHHECCMKSYLNDPKTDLVNILLLGLADTKNTKVFKKSTKIHLFLSKKYFHLKDLLKHQNSTKSNVLIQNSPKFFVLKELHDEQKTNIQSRPITPGSWNAVALNNKKIFFENRKSTSIKSLKKKSIEV